VTGSPFTQAQERRIAEIVDARLAQAPSISLEGLRARLQLIDLEEADADDALAPEDPIERMGRLSSLGRELSREAPPSAPEHPDPGVSQPRAAFRLEADAAPGAPGVFDGAEAPRDPDPAHG